MHRGSVLGGRYQIAEPVGEGATGTVYRAADLSTRQTVAIKVIHPTLAHNPKYTERLHREARLAAALDSPYVVRVLDVGEHAGLPFLVMEFVPGETLADEMDRRSLALPDVLRVALQVAQALAAAHARGIVHRDLKPQNIKIADGHVKVLDFGIARAHGDPAAGSFAGTPEYAAPEQAQGGADRRSDIYALGVILFQMLAGRRPFTAREPRALLQQHRDVPPPPLPAAIPPAIRQIVARCLAKDPADRYQTADELVQALADAPGASGRSIQLPDQIERAAARRRATPGAPAEPADTAELPAPDPGRTNLPMPRTSFVGRRREVAEVKRNLVALTTRLLTLTGTGGCGKTRLALQVATEMLEVYRDGVWTVDLAALAEPALVPQAVAAALGVREAPERPLVETLGAHLQPCHVLLVLDNCEHLLDVCAALVETLLDGCPALQVLATSREPIGARGEVIWRVPSLTVPEEQTDGERPRRARGVPASITASDAVQLLVARAQVRQRSFHLTARNAAAVAEICRRLDGIPLAIELAAMRLRGLPVDQLAARLAERFRMLTGATRRALSREHILRATLDWSYDLLPAPAQILFRRLAVFAGGFDADAAAAIAAPEIAARALPRLLARLAEEMLLVADPAPAGTRYRVLEPLRQYGAEKLQAAGEAADVHARHRDWYLALAEQMEWELSVPGQVESLARLGAEGGNLREALAWAVAGGPDQTDAALRMIVALWRSWVVQGALSEARAWIEQVLAAGSRGDPALRSKALNGAGVVAQMQGDYTSARAYLRESLHLARSSGDRRRMAAALGNLAIVTERQGNFDEARRLLEETLTLAHEMKDEEFIAATLSNLGALALAQGDADAGRGYFEECLTLAQQLGHAWGIAIALNSLGNALRAQGDVQGARARYEESLTFARDQGARPEVARTLSNLGDLAREQGDHETAQRLLTESLSLRRELGSKRDIIMSLEAFATLEAARAQPERAIRLLGAAARFRDEIGLRLDAGSDNQNKQTMAQTRTALGDSAFAAAWREGYAMTLERAIDYALGPVDPASAAPSPPSHADATS